MDPDKGTYHVLLIGIDRYPSAPLAGCVNDIDAIERLLLDPPGVGFPAERIRVRRLAAPLPGAPIRTRFGARTEEPIRANVLAALGALAGPAVSADDRVLVYYSGHGSQTQWTTRMWHESLVSADGQPIHDVELNALLAAIAARTTDLTVVLDCCHSSGATRDIVKAIPPGEAAVRSFEGHWGLLSPPDLTQLPGAAAAAVAGATLRLTDPPYLVVAACQSDETAGEKDLAGMRHGNLTRALVQLVGDRDSEARAELRWGAVWPDLMGTVHEIAAARPATAVQNPWLTGRPERRVFGGVWERRDLGFAVTRDASDVIHVHAGEVMGVTVGATLAVYAAEPARFPALGTPEDDTARVGRLRVTVAERSRCVAEVDGAPFVVPEGARARMVRPGEAERLRVRLDPFDAQVAAACNASPLLHAAAEQPDGVDVMVTGSADKGWTLGNDIEARVASVPAGAVNALVAGLESYARYHAALRLAQRCNDPELANRLQVRLLEVEGQGPFTDEKTAALPPCAKVSGDYALVEGLPFCIEVGNDWRGALNVTLLNCTAGGKVEYLGATQVQGGAREVFWLGDRIGQPFEAWPSMGRSRATDRVLAVATTRDDVSLVGMAVDDNVQDAIDRVMRKDITRDIGPRGGRAAPAELWTAQTATVVIYQPGHAPAAGVR